MPLPLRQRPKDFIVIALVGLLVLLPVVYAKGGEEEESAARSALALAKAARERSTKPVEAQPICFTDPDAATAQALKDRKPLVLWVGGLKCKDHPEFRTAVGDAIHCHIPNHDGDRTHRVVIAAGGVEYFILAPNLSKEKGEKVRRMWREPAIVPGARAKVIEEFGYAPPARYPPVLRNVGNC